MDDAHFSLDLSGLLFIITDRDDVAQTYYKHNRHVIEVDCSEGLSDGIHLPSMYWEWWWGQLKNTNISLYPAVLARPENR